MIRKTVSALILVPLAIVLVIFAVANRQVVVVSFDPFDSVHPALSAAFPLFVLILILVIAGVIIGGIAAWLGESKWGARARGHEREAGGLRRAVEQRKQGGGVGAPPIPGGAGRRVAA